MLARWRCRVLIEEGEGLGELRARRVEVEVVDGVGALLDERRRAVAGHLDGKERLEIGQRDRALIERLEQLDLDLRGRGLGRLFRHHEERGTVGQRGRRRERDDEQGDHEPGH
jgi:hypothetical protein